jgi:L-asparaginase
VCKDKKIILILNTGGTFNKVYDQSSGKLIVPKDNETIKTIVQSTKINYLKIDGMIFKDSLEITKQDRELLKQYILDTKFEKIVIVHGTDTMNKTAKYLCKHIKNKQIVLTGSMVPFSLNQIEPTSNLTQAITFLQKQSKNNVYIAMHGEILKHNKIYKNKEIGIFECR